MADERTYGVIVVGSGLAGAQACQTLVDAGADVLLIDAGITDRDGRTRFPDLDFESVRRTVDTQRRLFLGQNLEGVPWGELKVGAQLTPPRMYLTEAVDRWLRIVSERFTPMETLAYGGLGNAWGAGCCMFSQPEFSLMGFDRSDFMDAYQTVAERIGISADSDDVSDYTVAGLHSIMPRLDIEPRMEGLLQRYANARGNWNAKGFRMGRPALAIITRPHNDREPFAYEDMDFWHDNRRSVYRPWMTVDALNEGPLFKKALGRVALSYTEHDDGVVLHTRRLDNGETEDFKARTLLLCPGVLGSARIVLRSSASDARLPILCNPYSYVPLLDWRHLGKAMPARRSGMGQLSVFHDLDGGHREVSMASLYTYRSLMLFRLVKEAPLNFSDARELMRYMLSGLTIAGIHHSERGGDGRQLWLESDSRSPTGDVLRAKYERSEMEKRDSELRDTKFMKFFRALGQLPLKQVNPGMGASIHYAGALPVSTEERPFHTSHEGRLHGTQRVWVGDASTFRYLPAKGISFTLMANAHRVASGLVHKLSDI